MKRTPYPLRPFCTRRVQAFSGAANALPTPKAAS